MKSREVRMQRVQRASDASARRDITRSPRPVVLAHSYACERDGPAPTEASAPRSFREKPTVIIRPRIVLEPAHE